MGSTSATAAYLVDAFSECITQNLAAGEKEKMRSKKSPQALTGGLSRD
jgi:hypothetical protein